MKNIVDPTFLRKTNYSYVDYNDVELSSVLCFALSKNNADLILHQQRIELYVKTKQPSLLFSALVDLYIALGDKGQDYKQRMLEVCRAFLSTNQTTILTKSLASRMLVSKPINDLKHSILNSGNQGKILSTNHLSEFL